MLSDRNDNNGVNMLFYEQEHSFWFGKAETRNEVGFDSENDDDNDLHFSMNGGFSKESCPKGNDFESSEPDTNGILMLETQQNSAFYVFFEPYILEK